MAVIAKAPRPGHVKTRLQGLLTPDEAARLGTAFLGDVLENLEMAARLAPIDTVVAYAPAGQEARFDGLLPPGASLLLADGTGGEAAGVTGFGRVLLEAVRALLGRGYGAACVIAADCPTMPTAALVRAAESLLGGAGAAFGETEDGGYYLLGLRTADSLPFARVRWSTEHAAADTRARLEEAGLATESLPLWFDIDDPPSLRRLLEGDDGYAAPRTRALLAQLRLYERLRTAA